MSPWMICSHEPPRLATKEVHRRCDLPPAGADRITDFIRERFLEDPQFSEIDIAEPLYLDLRGFLADLVSRDLSPQIEGRSNSWRKLAQRRRREDDQPKLLNELLEIGTAAKTADQTLKP